MSRSSNNEKPVIMVLEPDALIRTAISEFLRECGYHVVEGNSADDVWTVIQAGRRLDVVFSEVRLNGAANGFALASELRQTHPGIDVILNSGIADAAEKSSELCERGPMKKPYHPQEVVTRIRLLLERRRTAQKD